MIKIMNGKPVIVDEDGKTRVLFDNLPGDIGGTPGYNELLEDVQNLMDYVYETDLYTENKTPYFFRASGGGVDVGVCENDTLVGGSIGYNQLVPNTGSSLSVTVTSGHKYVMKKSGTLSVGSSSGSALTGLTGGTDMVTDLTLELGTAVADRVYTLEQSTPGSGITQLKAWGFDFSTYIPYCAPTLRHVEGVSAHKFVGFNQWDEEWEVGGLSPDAGSEVVNPNQFRVKNYIPVLSGRNYYLYNGNGYTIGMRYYDANKNYIGAFAIVGINKELVAGQSSLPTNTAYMKFVVTTANAYHNDICINLSNSAKNGQYEPYRTWSYALDASLTLRGVPKLDASNNLYYDGDTYEHDGTVTRNCAVRAYQSGDESLADAITDGTNTVYKLSTPTTEQATPFAEYQEVDANGTEEYVSTGVVPVGHVTKYPTDLKGKLEQILEGVPTSDGTYVLTATVSSGKATYSWESTSSAKTSVKEPIDTLEKEVVEKPSEEEPVEEPVEEEQPVEEVTEEHVAEEQEEEQPVEETDE